MKKTPGLFVPSPLQTRIMEHLRKGRDSAQGIMKGVDTTLDTVRDALNTLRHNGLVTKSPVSFELAEKVKK